MKLAHKLARAVGGLFVAGAIASGANAAIKHPTTDVENTGGSELVLAVYDFSTATTHVLDTGIDFNDVLTLSDGVIANMDMTGIDLGNSTWAVFAGDSIENNVASDPANSGKRLLTTSEKDGIDLPAVRRTNLAAALSNIGSFINGHNIESGNTDVDLDNQTTANAGDGNFGQWLNNAYVIGAPEFKVADVDIGATSFFYAIFEEWVVSGFGNAYNDILETLLGSMTLHSNGDLEFNAVDPIPLPAAAWLMISGLAGLVGVSRRRSAQA